MGRYVGKGKRGIPILVPIFSIVADISSAEHNQRASVYLLARLMLPSGW